VDLVGVVFEPELELDEDFEVELEPLALEPDDLAVPDAAAEPLFAFEDDGVDAVGVELDGVEVAGVDFAAPEPLTYLTDTVGAGAVFEPASPIRTPTPRASSNVAIPARSVVLDDQPERGGGTTACSTGLLDSSVNRGLPRRVPHSTQ
jgi:hypothetical protein